MKFPSDQELFPDIGPDGKPDPNKFSGNDTVSSVFHRTVDEHPISSVHVPYRRFYGLEDTGPTDYEITSAIDTRVNHLFATAAEKAYLHTKDGCIGKFPVDTLHLGAFDNYVKAFPIDIDISHELHQYTPSELLTGQEYYSKAVDAKKDMRLSRAGFVFLLLHFFIVLACALPLIPGLSNLNCFDLGWDWAIILGACLSLIIAWIFHAFTHHTISALGIAHMILLIIFLFWQKGELVEVKSRAFQAGIVLVIILVALVIYWIDSFGGYNKSCIRDFTRWCDEDAMENYRKLRFFTLWQKNVDGSTSDRYKKLNKSFLLLLSSRKRF